MRAWRTLAIVCLLVLGASWELQEQASRRTQQQAVWLFYDTLTTNAQQVAAAISRAGGRVRHRSRWLHAVSADIEPARARRLPHIIHVQSVGRMFAAVAAGRGSVRADSAPPNPFIMGPRPLLPFNTMQALDSAAYGLNYGALRELGVPQAHLLGFTGAGVRIAIIDTGFEPDHEVFEAARLAGRIVAQRDFINNDGIVATQPGDPPAPRDQEVHGTWVWSILGGNKRGQIIGPAYNAQFILAKVDVEQTTDDVAADEDRWVDAVEWADSMGARVINSSLAFKNFSNKTSYTAEQMDGDFALSTRWADEAARRGIVLVNAIGNTTTPAGPRSLFAPADADSIISVGAVDNVGQVWPNSARGPTADNRIKPELVARGVGVYAANALTNGYQPVPAGTSLATPFVAGIAAIFMEAWPSLNAMAVRQALIQSGSNATFPDNVRGYGVPNVAAAIMFPEGLNTAGVEDVDLVTNVLTTIRPIFRWRGLVHPSMQPRYRLELASDVQFNTIIYQDTVRNSLELPLKQPLRPRQAIWWRVTAESPVGQIRRSTPVAPPISMPNWVTLLVLNEPGQQHVNTTRPLFSWQPITAPPPLGPLTYELQILNSAGQVVQTMPSLMSASLTLANPLTPNLSYRWRVIARSQAPGVADTVASRGTFVVNSSSQPPTTALYPSFPNPFPRAGEDVTRFWFDLAQASAVELTIHDLRGRLVRRLIPASNGCPPLASGQYGRGVTTQVDPCVLLAWDGRDQNNKVVARGVYVARLRANRTTSTQRIVFLGGQ